MSRRVVIDTDPGIDDAIAILFALARPGLDVVAITTVAGNIGIETTTRNALKIQALIGTNVPVHAGAAAPLNRPPEDARLIHGSDGLGGVAFPDPTADPHVEDAVAALERLLMEAPAGTLDILALAPLTNIAQLIETAPEAARRIGRLISMGGAVHEPGNVGPRSEFNIAHDPEAAEVVLSAGLPMTLIPLDVTRKVRADRAYLDHLAALGTPQATASRDLIEAYFTGTAGGQSRPLHDPCVTMLAARPDLFSTETMRLKVDLGEGGHVGALDIVTEMLPDRPTVEVALGARSEEALDVLAETLGPKA